MYAEHAKRSTQLHVIQIAIMYLNEARKVYGLKRIKLAEDIFKFVHQGFFQPQDIGTDYKELTELALRRWYQWPVRKFLLWKDKKNETR